MELDEVIVLKQNLKEIQKQIWELISNWDGKLNITHIPREKNKEADRLSNVAMDRNEV